MAALILRSRGLTAAPTISAARLATIWSRGFPALIGDFGPEGRRVRCDFWHFIGEQVANNYFGQIQEWCHKNGIASTGHLLSEEDITAHVGFYGNFSGAPRGSIFPAWTA